MHIIHKLRAYEKIDLISLRLGSLIKYLNSYDWLQRANSFIYFSSYLKISNGFPFPTIRKI